MNSNDVIIKNSEIEGKGVFAHRNFKKGEIVLRWDVNHTLDEKDINNVPESEKKYISIFQGKYTIMQEPERYVNHSCNPNTMAKDFCDIAVRDILKGEEITGNYADNSEPGDTMICKCKSKNCKKIINY